jgi:hypothetical protein
VDKEGCLGMAEVKRGEVGEVGDQKDLSRPEVAADPEHDESEDEKIVLGALASTGHSGVLKKHTRMKWLPTLAAELR